MARLTNPLKQFVAVLCITATAALAGSPGAAAYTDEAAWLFDPGAVSEIELALPQDSIDALNADPGEYVDGTFALTSAGGTTYGPLAVGIRLKGSIGSFRPLTGKAAFKLKFNHSVSGQKFQGLKKLTLNNMVQDASNVHELLTYESFRAMGIPAPRTGYAYVRVNGEDYGLYLNVETLDDVALKLRFATTKHLYEGESSADVRVGGAGDFEVDEGSSSDRSDLEALIAAANAGPDPWSGGMAAVADLDQMTRMWAVEKYTAHWDGYAGGMAGSSNHPNNYYLHSDSAGVFRMLPWGTDQTLVYRIPFDGAGGILFDHCAADPVCLPMFRDALLDTRDAVAALDLDGLAVSTAAVLHPWQQTDPRREYSLDQIASAVFATRAFLAARPGDANAFLFGLPPEEPPARGAGEPSIAVAGAVAGSTARPKKCKKRGGKAAAARRCKLK